MPEPLIQPFQRGSAWGFTVGLSPAKSTLMWAGGDPPPLPARASPLCRRRCPSSCWDVRPAGFCAGERGWGRTECTQMSMAGGRPSTAVPCPASCPGHGCRGGSRHHLPPIPHPLLPEHRLSRPDPSGAGGGS